MMQYRRVAQTTVHLSVVGFGTAQLQMLPERQAVETLKRGFDLGVNWVHTAPDYGGVEEWIARAVEESGREIIVLSQGPAFMSMFDSFFENTCRLFKKPRLEMYGINCIDDIERIGQNVWDKGGMVEYLLEKKAEGRLNGIFCTTHGAPEYIEKLVTSGVFDAIMVAYNPLGYHLLTYDASRDGRAFEDLAATRARVFPLAAKHGVSLLVMKPLAGGLLCRGKAFPPHDSLPLPEEPAVTAGELLKYVLEEPGVCAVVPGVASVEEAEEDAWAGHSPLPLSPVRRLAIESEIARLRLTLCSRCGKCEPTCSKSLPISSMFRDAYIWSGRNETFMASDEENYFRLHPDVVLACATCVEQTCRCPQGIDIPAALTRAHAGMLSLRETRQHPGAPKESWSKVLRGHHQMCVLSEEVTTKLRPGEVGLGRFLVQNVGDTIWTAYSHRPDPNTALGVSVVVDGRLVDRVPIRQNVCPEQRSHLVWEFRAPAAEGTHDLRFCLAPLAEHDATTHATCFYSGLLSVEGNGNMSRAAQPSVDQTSSPAPLPAHVAPVNGSSSRVTQVLRRAGRAMRTRPRSLASRARRALRLGPGRAQLYGVGYREHTIPGQMTAGTTYGVRLTLENRGRLTWTREGDHPVEMIVSIDDGVFSVLKIPRPRVRFGEEVSFHFALRAPKSEGLHYVKVEAVHQHLAWFSSLGVEPLSVAVQVDKTPLTPTASAYDLALRHNLWHYLPTQGIQFSRDGRPFPLFVSRAKGCRIWDPEGREYIDYTMGWGSTILGYADERIQSAIAAMLETAPLAPYPHPIEMDVSRMLVEDFPCAEMVVFGKNGSDVCTVAARLGRLITGKRTILSCGFHGWQDFALDHFGLVHSGIPERRGSVFHKFRFNDRADFFRLYARYKNDLAAVMIEPAGPWGGETIGPEADANAEFLQTIAAAAREIGALLIFDEIITGYRYPGHSVQKATGVTPDLACLGKALASGMPLAALVGPSRIFFDGFSRTHYCPTFKGEVYSLAAAKAAIETYRREPVAQHIWEYGRELRKGINLLCSQIGVAAACKGPPFRMCLMFEEENPEARRLMRTLYVQELLKAGIVTVTGVMLPSYAHDRPVLARTLDAVGSALEVVATAQRMRDFDRYLEIPLL